MNQVHESIIRRIKKALALAQNNPSVHESQTALLMAQKIMAQYGLSAADVQGSAQVKEVAHEPITSFGRTPWWKRQLGLIVGENFRCTMYIRSTGGANRLIFLGLKEDVEIATEVYRFAEESIQYHALQYCRSIKSRIKNRTIHNRYRNKFMMGYMLGLRSKYMEQVEENDWGLVLVKDALVLEEEAKMNMKKRNAIRPQLSRSKEAFLKGFEKGRAFEVPVGMLEE